MILRTTTGRSFKGVGQYVLHDKGAQSNDRVSFIETENLAFEDGQTAIAEMIRTHVKQKALTRRATGRATATSKPVYHLTLSWDTSENPSLADQMDTARDAINALGLGDRQALIVGHTDTDNPHVHVVVNLVCPTTGKTASLSNDRVKLSNWAEQYRRDRGQEHFCPQRADNNKRRKEGGFVKADNMSRPEYEAWNKSQTKNIWDLFRADRANAKKSRRGQYDALWRQKDERVIQRKAEIKAYFKPQWGDLFKRQRHELKNFDAGLFDRVGFALGRSGRSKIIGVLQAVTNDGNLRAEFIQKHDDQRQQLGKQHKARIIDASREAYKAWQLDKDALIASHKAEDQRAHDEAKAKSSEVWKSPDLNQSGQDFDATADRRKDQPTRRKFADKIRDGKAEEEIKKARSTERKRRSRPRRKGRDRGGITPD